MTAQIILLAMVLAAPFSRNASCELVFKLNVSLIKGWSQSIEVSPMCFWRAEGRDCVGMLVSNSTHDSASLVFVDCDGAIRSQTGVVPFRSSKQTMAAVFRASENRLYLSFNRDTCYLLADSGFARVEDPWSASALARWCPGVRLAYVYDIDSRKRPMFFVLDSTVYVIQPDSALVVYNTRTGARTIDTIDYPDFNYLISQSSDPFVFGSLRQIVLYEDPFLLHFFEMGRTQLHSTQDLWKELSNDLLGKKTNIRAEAGMMGISLFQVGRSVFVIVFAQDSILAYRVALSEN